MSVPRTATLAPRGIRTAAVAASILVGCGALPAAAQVSEPGPARVTAGEEILRPVPGGSRIGRLFEGAALEVSEVRQGWAEVTVEGFVPANRLRDDPRDPGSAIQTGGQDLLDRPGGERIGRGDGGMLVEAVEREGDWARVRRTAWIAAAALAPAEAPAVAGRPAAPEAAAPAAEREAAPAADAAPAPPEGPVVILDRPGGDTIAVVYDSRTARVGGRDGGWTRIRVEGWTAERVEGGGGSIDALTPAEVRADPAEAEGRRVEWTAQFLSIQRASEDRLGITPGEWYVLARSPDGQPGLVYVVLNAEQRQVVRQFAPLQRFTVRGTVRVARAPQTGHPVLVAERIEP